MAIQKQHGKGRKDRWYHLAKEKGYRARAAFKLIQLNKKYHVLEKSRVLIDLCAAPGSWCQVAAEVMPTNSLIVGVDLSPIKSIPRCITFQSDITTDKCRATLRSHLKTMKADTVLHDGAPNVGTAWVQDAFSQAELVLQSLRLATDFLGPGGTFITKIFRSKDYNSLLWVFNQLFTKVEATKPPSSRNVSAEIFVVCLGFKAPKKIDPRFLDAKSVFAEVAGPAPNNEAKVFNPEKKKRKREGYEEGDYTQFKEKPVSEFIQTLDPIAMLGSLNKLSFDQSPNGDLALATLERMPETTQEVRDCCADLKVLGRKEFKVLLRWRLKVRDVFGFSSKKGSEPEAGEDEVAEVEPMDEEMKLQEDMQRFKDQADSKKKKEKRRDNEKKRKEIVRLQMNMTTPNDIGLEQSGPNGEDSMFGLKTVEQNGGIQNIKNNKMHSIAQKVEPDEEVSQDSDSDEEADDLEGQLDAMYEDFTERKAMADAKYRAKRARKEHKDDDFEGFSDRSDKDVTSDEEIVQDDDSDDSEDEVDINTGDQTSSSAQSSATVLSKRAAMFFDQDIFKGIDGLDQLAHEDSGIDMEISDENEKQDTDKILTVKGLKKGKPTTIDKSKTKQDLSVQDDDESDDGFEVVKRVAETSWDEGDVFEEPMQNGRPDIDIITAEAMTLAHAIATGTKTKQSLMDDGFNKYSLRDVDGLPDWFLDDENEHSRPSRPITAAAAAAIKEKVRALNARPIKKVREAQARKKFRAAQRLEKLKKKSALLVEDSDMTEKDKAEAVRKLMSKASKKKPKQKVTVVVARGGNRGLSGRPQGTKGKYKMVDARLKKDTRGLKRAAKRKK